MVDAMSEIDQEAPAREPFIRLSNERELHALIDTVPDAIIVIDKSGNIRSFSKGAEKMFGFSEADVAGENVSLLMPSPDRENHDGYIQRYLETGEAHIIGIGRVTTARHRDGNTFPINLSIGELKVDGTIGFVGFIRDLTEKREAERELHTLQAELAHVSRITSMGSLATSLAHELNQPLTAVANYANAARDLLEKPGEKELDLAREAMNECASEAVRAGQIVRRLRDFIERGDTDRRAVSLKRLVKEASALALMNGDGKGVQFETELDDDVDEVLVDPIQVQQIVLNLLRNALEAMQHIEFRRLRITSAAYGTDFVRVEVSDSGPGIEPHVAERLFHPFNSTKPSGMGLGLSICHSILNAHGGKIWVEPSELGGTSFHFTLPLATSEEDHG